jgi:hypothetical protein
VLLVADGAPLLFEPDLELIDTPPALDESVPGILRADALIIPRLTRGIRARDGAGVIGAERGATSRLGGQESARMCPSQAASFASLTTS